MPQRIAHCRSSGAATSLRSSDHDRALGAFIRGAVLSASMSAVLGACLTLSVPQAAASEAAPSTTSQEAPIAEAVPSATSQEAPIAEAAPSVTSQEAPATAPIAEAAPSAALKEAPATAPIAEAAAASASSTPELDATWIILPVGGYSPETSVQLGAVAIRYWHLDPKSRPSSLPIVLLLTAKKQTISDIQPELYWDNDNYRFWAELELQRYPDRFYGIGNSIKESDRESFERTFGRLRMNLRRRLVGAFYAGFASDHQLAKLTNQEPGGKLAQGSVPGTGGGFTSGLGLSVAYDTRNSRSYPTDGLFIDLTGVALLRAFGSEYQFASTKLDARTYLGFGARQVLALRYVFHTTPGDPPFYMLPELGGANILRGYYSGKYRDKMLQALEAEYRLRLFWRLGAVAFGGIGQVAHRLNEVSRAPLRPAIGGGIRINMTDDDIVNLRFDVGYWPGTLGFYFSVLEEF